MRKQFAILLTVIILTCPPALSLAGSVSGTIDVFRTKVKTDGPKSDRDVVVYLQPIPERSFGPVDAATTMDQRGLVFIPHVLPVQLGTTVTFLNNDNDQHNVYFLFDRTGETLDIGTWAPGETVSYTFDETGTAVTLCKLHLEMAAYIIVLDTPYYTTAALEGSSQKGRYLIEGVPAGKYILYTWHKKLKMKGGAREITVGQEGTTVSDISITKPRYAK